MCIGGFHLCIPIRYGGWFGRLAPGSPFCLYQLMPDAPLTPEDTFRRSAFRRMKPVASP
ncbi:hypothetical protein DFP95_11036 [Cohnella lupini]|uniref:Uncharacterized protein n=1 Tax=Cohnella lupini TaxID=1294267 RepID=A0A3D9I712_9BACL|nr:hypothetical protein DFP95_11036 [Cohnella lupini]